MAQSADRDANRALRARFDEVFSQYQRLRSGMDELQQRLAELRITAESDDGLVRATVGPRGQLISLELDPRIYRRADPDELAEKITDTVRRATDQSVDQVQQVMSGYLPAGSGAVGFLKDNNFGTLLKRQDAMMREEAGDA